MKRAVIGAICVFFCLALAAFGQTVTVTGVVRAPGAMPAPGATLAIQGEAGTKNAFSDDDGRFKLALPPRQIHG